MAYGNSSSIKFILLGDSGVGKSSIIHRLRFKEFAKNIKSTIGFDNYVMSDKNFKAKVTIWDTAGMERYKTISRSYYINANSVLLVFGMDNRLTLDNLAKWKQEASQYIDNAQWVVIGNKCDLASDVTPEYIENFLRHNGCEIFLKFSTKTGYLFEGSFDKLIDLSLTRLEREKDEFCGSLENPHNSVIFNDRSKSKVNLCSGRCLLV